MKYEDAKTACTNKGATLAIPNSAAELSFIRTSVTPETTSYVCIIFL